MEDKKCETCSYHREEVLKRSNQKEDIVALKHTVEILSSTVAGLVTTSALMRNDMGYIKKPLSVVAIAVILYVAGALLKAIPFIPTLGGTK